MSEREYPTLDSQSQAAGADAAPSPFYIQAASPVADEQTRVLKHGDTFAVFDHYGDVKQSGLGEEGLYHDGTRHLSGYLLLLDKHRPLFLSSTVREDNDFLSVDLTNPDLLEKNQVAVPRGTLHILRCKFLWRSTCYERVRFKNFGLAPVEVNVSLHFRADFADIFEVRGTHRARRGRNLAPRCDGSDVVLAYEGLDGVLRQTRLVFDPPPAAILNSEACFRASLPSHGETAIDIMVSCDEGRCDVAAPRFEAAYTRAVEEEGASKRHGCTIRTSSAQFNEWLNRAVADLFMMTTQKPTGPYPYAGVPWFSTPFGRDALVTALECLWFDPDLARGVLAFLAETQATEYSSTQDAEPGKILHEARGGEMAALGEVPFGRYYGSVDATPLFVWLAGEYFTRTADRAFAESIWIHVKRALDWIDKFGDRDNDGFVEYLRNSPNGLGNQGWKDSHDSVSHADGTLAEGPIALCEVQGHVYAAQLAAAQLADAFGEPERAKELKRQAATLKEKFERVFWCDERGTYALALDGGKRPCRVSTSNAGHCLWTGIAEPEAGRRCGLNLLSNQLFSGWGIRTLGNREARYNPMSYHNGSVWPHDNALAAAGLARYGLRTESERILAAMFDVSKAVDFSRMPELFCGFERRRGQGPTRYPVACAPQAWSAAAVFLLLQTCLGLSISAERSEVLFTRPALPEFLERVEIKNLKVGSSSVDIRLQGKKQEICMDVPRNDGNIQVRLAT